MMRTRRIGYCVSVVGPGHWATADAIEDAEAVGRFLADGGWITRCGGLAVDVMAAALATGLGESRSSSIGEPAFLYTLLRHGTPH